MSFPIGVERGPYHRSRLEQRFKVKGGVRVKRKNVIRDRPLVLTGYNPDNSLRITATDELKEQTQRCEQQRDANDGTQQMSLLFHWTSTKVRFCRTQSRLESSAIPSASASPAFAVSTLSVAAAKPNRSEREHDHGSHEPAEYHYARRLWYFGRRKIQIINDASLPIRSRKAQHARLPGVRRN